MKPGPIVSTLAGAALLCALGAANGCSKPQPPEKERPVDPQAAQMRDATRPPLDQARAVEATVDQSVQQTRIAIDAARG